MKKILIAGFLFVNAIFCFSTMAQAGACSTKMTQVGSNIECVCDAGQPLGSCLTLLNSQNSNRYAYFPTSWKITQPGQFTGWELHMNPAGEQIVLAYMGQVQAIYPVNMRSAVKSRHFSKSVDEYLVTGEASLYLDQLPITLRYIATSQVNLSYPVVWHKVLCVGDLCYAAD